MGMSIDLFVYGSLRTTYVQRRKWLNPRGGLTVTKEQLDALDRWEETPEVYQRVLGQLRDGRWVSVHMQSIWGVLALPSG